MTTESGSDAYALIIGRLEKEKNLVERLTELLREELDFISNQDVESLEESMPEKHQILRNIAENRQERNMTDEPPEPELAEKIRGLQQDLVVLWRKVSGFNDLSKSLVTGRLEEIGRQLEVFFSGDEGRYDRQGKKAKGLCRAVNTGV
jgi:hypothetical protein